MKTLSALMTLVLINSAYAQNSSTATTTPPAGAQDSAQTSTATVDVKPAAKTSSPFILGFKSSIDSGREAYQDRNNARTMSAKNELFMGYKDSSGWGGFLNGVQYYRTFTNNTRVNPNWVNSDASITLIHPDFYKTPELTLFGQLRYYFHTTPRTRDAEIDHYAYYFRLNGQLAANQEIYNELIPRYFNTKNPKGLPVAQRKSYTTYYVEDMTIYNYKLNDVVKVGALQWSQYEIHAETRPGFTMEAGPTATFTLSRNLSISPSIRFPVLVSNSVEGANAYSVNDGPTSATADQAVGNLFIQARF